MTVVARCDSAQEFVTICSKSLQSEGFDILAVEELAPLSEGRFEMNDMIREFVADIEAHPFRWSTFDLYKNH